MGKEIDLLINYPRTKRDVKQRGSKKTEEDRVYWKKIRKRFLMVSDVMVTVVSVTSLIFGSLWCRLSKSIST